MKELTNNGWLNLPTTKRDENLKTRKTKWERKPCDGPHICLLEPQPATINSANVTLAQKLQKVSYSGRNPSFDLGK